LGLPDAAALDLTRYSRKVQRALYRLTVAHFWTPRRTAPPYTPEQAELRILFRFKRWFAIYHALEDAASNYLPPADHEPLLRITYDRQARFGLHFTLC
jgi:hypothetical protein